MYYTQAYMYVRYQRLSCDTFLRSPMGELFELPNVLAGDRHTLAAENVSSGVQETLHARNFDRQSA